MAEWQAQDLRAHRDRLLQAGVPYLKVRRHLRELRDHYAELHREALARGLEADAATEWVEAQLGSLREIGARMLLSTSRRSVLHRHPVLLLTVLPVLVLIGLCIPLVLVLLASDVANPDFSGPVPEWMVLFFAGGRLAWMYAGAPLLALGICWLGLRSGLPARYWKLGVLIICLVGSSLFMEVNWPEPGNPGSGSIGAAVGYPVGMPDVLWGYVGSMVRLAISLLLCAGFVRLLRRRQLRELLW